MKSLNPLALAIAASLPAIALAQTPRDEALKLSDTLITANRDVEQRTESSAANTVFTRADIERLRPVSVLELLTHVPGVQVTNYGGRGALYGLYVRGTSTAQSLILIDGVRVNSATAGIAGLQYLSVDQIERIEVLRGSRSALYGSDAMGGVIQLFTRRGNGPGLNPYLRVAGGSNNTWERSLGLSGGDDRTRFNLSAALEETEGFDRTRTSTPADRDDDAYRNRSMAASISHRLSDRLQLGLNVLDQRGKTEIDDSFAGAPGRLPYDHFAVSSTSAFLEGQLHENWTSRVELGHSEDKQENREKWSTTRSVNNTYRDSVTWLNTLDLTETQRLRLGAEYVNDKVRSSNSFTESSRKNHALFVQHSYQGQGFSTEVGMRHDKNEQFGTENTFNGALTLPLNKDHQIILSYAEGFRVPTFADLYWPAEAWYVGNPDLAPEKSRSYELQWRGQISADTRIEASVYRTDFRNLITYVSDPVTFLGTMNNVERARINGFEASLHQELLGWQSTLGLSVIDPRNRDTGHTLQNRAKRTLSLDIDRNFGRIAVGASWRAVSSSYGDSANNTEIAGHGVFDLRSSWQASDELSFDLKLANLLDKDYSRLLYTYDGEQYGYQEAPFSVMLGMTWSPAL
ncbi:TonB-dependent receptor [Pseudomonas sp. S5(2021)]|jgi:vitamin B12 transporter|nr:TonB-dependent receptor [Stutzerimonas balearica]MBZ5757177.1 TonB-dependent receptor [Pseudomonas sp. S5(2021)]